MINETQIDPNNDINNWSTCHTMIENKNKQLKYKTRKSADKEKVINEFLQQNIHLPVNELYEKCIKQFPHEKKKKKSWKQRIHRGKNKIKNGGQINKYNHKGTEPRIVSLKNITKLATLLQQNKKCNNHTLACKMGIKVGSSFYSLKRKAIKSLKD